MAEQWLSIVEYARTFRVSDMTVRRRIKTGKLHAVLQEGKYFIPVPVGEAGKAASSSESHSVPPPPPKRPGEMTVVKGHPSPQKSYPSYPPPSLPQVSPLAGGKPSLHPGAIPPPPPAAGYHGAPVSDLLAEDEGESMLPTSLRRPLYAQEQSLVDTRALLAFCEATMKKLGENERRAVERFKSKLEALEMTVVAKDQEIKSLRQQLEDLQLLVKIMERRKPM